MGTTVLTNVPSLNAQRNLATSANNLDISLQRLSSGLRVNSAKDDAAGLAISERFTAQIRGIDQATRNANDGISMAQTGEGALGQAGSILQRVRELAVQSVNSTNSVSDRAALQAEVNALTAELDRIAATTAFNGQKLLDGSNSSNFQVGANAGETITANTTNFRTDSYGNYRIGSRAAEAENNEGDLTEGSNTGTRLSDAAINNVNNNNHITGGSVTINGSLGNATVTVLPHSSAKAAAKLINDQTATTGVTATVKTEIGLMNFSINTSYTISVTSNNTTTPVSISFTTGDALTSDGLAGVVNAINDASAKTGVTAQYKFDKDAVLPSVTLLNASGADIVIKNNSSDPLRLGFAALLSSSDTAVAAGQLALDSDKSFSVAPDNNDDFFSNASSNGSYAAQLQKTSQVDVSNVNAANRTIAIVDGALQAINGQRAKYGALQSRFETTVSNLRTTSENLSAARSRIRDADFAQETGNLTRNQILQQAGMAMLSQANALPQNVLSLLRG